MLDKSTLELYFADISTKTIISTTLHGKNKTVFYSSGFAQISRMAIDYSTGNIYYTARGSTTNENHIGVVKRFSSIHKTLHSNILTPRGIVLYPSKGFMFWTESYAGNVSRIGKSYMDGTLKVYIVTSGLNWPSGLAIDFKTNRLYWTDGYTDRIEYSDLNGGNRHVLTTDADAHLMSIVISGQHLFYTAWNRQRITKLDITTRSKVTFMSKHPELGRLDDLDIFADDTIDVHPICSKRNGECSTFCFPTPNGRTCGCEDDVGLQADQTTCEGVILCPSSIADAVLSSSCSRRAGESCEITCLEENGSHDIVCTSEGTWDQDTRQLCLIKLCPSTLKKGKLHSGCTAKVGNSCLFSCEDGYKSTINSSKIVCTSQGTWNENIEELCKEDKPNFENEWLTGVYIGSSVGGALIIVTLITALICVIKRVKSKSNASKRRPKDGHNSYLEFDNNVFLAYDGSKPYASVYSTIEDMRNF
ncbi:low-density lipoprotein receptor-related protein 4-like [Saccostrea cucullata]|uniref:low-density lipoprotein receptor-related protein 4-like n=1 Tax=Saccostrea cuccullata TaxID=36930 RepID=UPI002ED6A5C2